MSTLTYRSIMNHPHNLQSMVTKLPFTLQDRWRRETNKRRMHAGGVIPPFVNFVNFVNEEAGIATDPVFSREALRRLDGSLDRSGRSSKSKGKSFGKSKTPLSIVQAIRLAWDLVGDDGNVLLSFFSRSRVSERIHNNKPLTFTLRWTGCTGHFCYPE